MGKIYIFDIGTRLRTTLDINLAGYDTVEYSIKKPDGTSITRPCEVEGDESNGVVYYDTILNDLDQDGYYYIQVQIVFVSGSQFESVTQKFKVYDPFK